MTAWGSRPWILAGVLAALALIAASWLLVISPTRAETSTLRDNTVSAQQQNQVLLSEAERLRALDENRDQLKSDVRAALAALPADRALPDLNRELAAHAADRGVELVSISIASTVTPTLADPEAVVAPGLVGVPITIQTRGPAVDQLLFLRDVQEVGPRAALLSSTSLAALEGSVDDGSTLTTQLTVFAASLSATDRELLAEVLADDPTGG